LLSLLAALAMLPALAGAAERECEQSEATVTKSPDGRLAASVQHQVCATASGGVAAGVTVFIGAAAAPLQGSRVLMVAVPRNRDEWPRAVWQGNASLAVWVPNLAKVLETKPAAGDVTVALKYCGDDPEARARVAGFQQEVQQWMLAVTRWSELRRQDAAAAGPRPARPEEPRLTARACTDDDLAAAQ
jgi:hypothetical protein